MITGTCDLLLVILLSIFCYAYGLENGYHIKTYHTNIFLRYLKGGKHKDKSLKSDHKIFIFVGLLIPDKYNVK